MSNISYNRQPCPGRIFEDLGVGFMIGTAGGALYLFAKGTFLFHIKNYTGVFNAPKR